MTVAVGVDLGGTKVAAAVVGGDGAIVAEQEIASDASDPAHLCDQLADLVSGFDAAPVGVGLGAAGIISFAEGRYLYGPNTKIRDVDLAGMVSERVGLPVRLDNDANCATWAEHRFGVGRGTSHFLCVTVGTGIGGGFVFDGRPYRGATGGAAEIGHMLVDVGGRSCGCGQRGCWEQYASGTTLGVDARSAIDAHPDSSLAGLGEGLDGRAVTAAARAGDAFALEVCAGVARWLGWGLGSLVNIFEPERIAVSGGLCADWDLFSDETERAMRERVEAADRRGVPEVTAAALGPRAGVVGAALLVLDEAS